MDKDKELELLREWKSDLIKSLCKYDCSSIEELRHKAYDKGRADAIEELKPSADMVAYEQGRLDALDHCEKCETDQWDALYKAEMKGRADAITDFMCKALTKFYNFDLQHGYPTHSDVKDILLDVSNELKEQKK